MKTITQQTQEGILYWNSFLQKWEANKIRLQEWKALEEFEILKLLVVVDAEYYVKYENDLENWQNELTRLAAEIENLESSDLDNVDNLLHMQALCRDARGLLPEITFYYREKERLSRFETATSGPVDDESKKIMADVIRSMVSSDKR